MKQAKGAAVAGVVTCIACCAAPVLLAAGVIGAGLAAAVAAWLPWLSATLLVGSVVAIVLHRQRPQAAACTTDTALSGSCACHPAAETTDSR